MFVTNMKLAATAALLSVAAAFPFIPGPASQADTPSWLAQLYANRTAQRASVNYSGAVYDNYLLWSPSLHIVPQSHLYDRFLYDPVKGAADPAKGWTVDRFLDDLDARYGGVDGVLLWNTYPNLGVDERSQFDLLEDVPGGLNALRDVVAQFNARGVRVGIPYNPCAFLRFLHAPCVPVVETLTPAPDNTQLGPHRRGPRYGQARRGRRGRARSGRRDDWRRFCEWRHNGRDARNILECFRRGGPPARAAARGWFGARRRRL